MIIDSQIILKNLVRMKKELEYVSDNKKIIKLGEVSKILIKVFFFAIYTIQ